MRISITMLFSILSLLLLPPVNAQETVTTTDGRTLILKTDGTWEIVESPADTSNMVFHFRNTQWGMSKIQVIAAEEKEPYEDRSNYLVYREKIAERDCRLYYYFAQDSLVRTIYRFTSLYSNLNDYLTDFDEIKSILIDKYETPIDQEEYWDNKISKSLSSEHLGALVASGSHRRYVYLGNKDTNITLSLEGTYGNVNLQVEYISKKLRYLYEKQKKHLIQKDF